MPSCSGREHATRVSGIAEELSYLGIILVVLVVVAALRFKKKLL